MCWNCREYPTKDGTCPYVWNSVKYVHPHPPGKWFKKKNKTRLTLSSKHAYIKSYVRIKEPQDCSALHFKYSEPLPTYDILIWTQDKWKSQICAWVSIVSLNCDTIPHCAALEVSWLLKGTHEGYICGYLDSKKNEAVSWPFLIQGTSERICHSTTPQTNSTLLVCVPNALMVLPSTVSWC